MLSRAEGGLRIAVCVQDGRILESVRLERGHSGAAREGEAQNGPGRSVARNSESAPQIRLWGRESGEQCVHARPGVQVNCPAELGRVEEIPRRVPGSPSPTEDLPTGSVRRPPPPARQQSKEPWRFPTEPPCCPGKWVNRRWAHPPELGSPRVPSPCTAQSPPSIALWGN